MYRASVKYLPPIPSNYFEYVHTVCTSKDTNLSFILKSTLPKCEAKVASGAFEEDISGELDYVRDRNAYWYTWTTQTLFAWQESLPGRLNMFSGGKGENSNNEPIKIRDHWWYKKTEAEPSFQLTVWTSQNRLLLYRETLSIILNSLLT